MDGPYLHSQVSADEASPTSRSQPEAVELSPISVRLPPSTGEDNSPTTPSPPADENGTPQLHTPGTPDIPADRAVVNLRTTNMSLVHPARVNGNSFVVVDTTTHGDAENDGDDTDGINLSPEGLGPLLSQNQYTVRKMAAQALMDVALMMANISQLRTLITAGPDMEYYYVLVSMVGFSLVAQVLFAVIIFVVWMRETEDNYREEFMATIRQVAASKDAGAKAARNSVKMDRAKQVEKFNRHQTTNRLNYCTIVLVFTITVTNMFITGFGIKLEPTANVTGAAG